MYAYMQHLWTEDLYLYKEALSLDKHIFPFYIPALFSANTLSFIIFIVKHYYFIKKNVIPEVDVYLNV